MSLRYQPLSPFLHLFQAGLMLAGALLSSTSIAQPPLPGMTLHVGAHTVWAERANTPDTLREGLMDRTRLAPDSGMLFELGPADIYCFWMKNTRIPLSIAFIDAQQQIVSIQDMQPFSLEAHCPPVPITTALEMTQGWFTQAGVVPGDPVRRADQGRPETIRQD